MLKLFIFSLCLLGISPNLIGLLAPLEQNIAELQAILSDKRLSDAFEPAETLDDIWRLKNRYILSTPVRQMVVEVDYLPQKQPGPREFKLIFHQPQKFGE